VDRIDRVSRKYSLLTNVDKTKVMASDGIACRILIQVELVELHRGQGQMEVHDVANTRGSRTAKEQNRTGHLCVQHDG